jgi:hypothetical protein
MTRPQTFAAGMMVGAALVGLLYSCARAGSAALNWTASTQYTDGSHITAPVTYNVYKGKRGTVKPLLVSGLSVRRYVVSPLAGGQRVCFNVEAVVGESKSDLSNEGCKWIAKP